MGGGMPMGGGGRRRADVDTQRFYDILAVEKTATESEIKKAFRKQAMQHHPDKGGDPEKFKEISKAYEVLSDTEKRAQHMMNMGEEGLDGSGGGGGGADAMDIFDMFDAMHGGGGAGAGRTKKRRKGEDVIFPLKTTLEESV